MSMKSGKHKEPADKVVKDIRRRTRRQHSAEEKVRIVLEGLRGAESIVELCRREGIAQRSILQLVEGIPRSGQATPCPSRRLSQSPAGIG